MFKNSVFFWKDFQLEWRCGRCVKDHGWCAGALLLAGCGAGGGNGEATIATDSGEIKAVVEMDGRSGDIGIDR